MGAAGFLPLLAAGALVLPAEAGLAFEAGDLAAALLAVLAEALLALAGFADDFVPDVAPAFAGDLAIAALEVAGAVSGFSVAFAVEAAADAFLVEVAVVRDLPAVFVEEAEAAFVPFAAGALGAAAFDFAAGVLDLPLAVAPVLAGACEVALLDGVGSPISVALLAALPAAWLLAVLLVVVLVVVLATSILLGEYLMSAPVWRARKANRCREKAFRPTHRHGLHHI